MSEPLCSHKNFTKGCKPCEDNLKGDTKMSRRFDYVKYDELAVKQMEAAKKTCQILELEISELKEGRAKSLALTHLEITYMWIGKALRDECIERNPATEDVKERTAE